MIIAEPTLARLTAAQRAEMMDALEKRHLSISWLPSILGFCLFWTWMIAFGCVTDFLEDTRWDLDEVFDRTSMWGSALNGMIMLSLGLGTAVTLAIGAAAELRRRLLRRAIRKHLQTPQCFWCGYSLQGLATEQNVLAKSLNTCPECGNESAVQARSATVSP